MYLTQRQASTLADYLGCGSEHETKITCALINRIIRTNDDLLDELRYSKEWKDYIQYHELSIFGESYNVGFDKLCNWILFPEKELMKPEYAEYDDEPNGLQPITHYMEY